jgi:hypothetical protein
MLGSRIGKPLFFHCLTSSHHLHDRAWGAKESSSSSVSRTFLSLSLPILLLRLIIHRLSASNPVTNLPALPYTTKQFRYCGLGSIKGSSAAAVGTCRWVETSCWKACASSAKCGLEARCVHGRMSLLFELWWWELWLVGRQSEKRRNTAVELWVLVYDEVSPSSVFMFQLA